MQFKHILLILIFCSGLSHSEEPVVQPIPVVKTWKDLLDQPAIALGGGVTIRLGIENQKCPRWSGVLLYCLTEGYVPPLKGDLSNRVGPVYVELQHGEIKSVPVLSVSLRESSAMDEVLKRSKVLYCMLIPISEIGKLRVTARKSKDGDPLARIDLDGTDEFFHPWIPLELGTGHKEKLEPANEQENDVAVGAVSMRSEGIALPDWDGQHGIVYDGKTMDEKDALPKAIPTMESPQMTLAVKGKGVRITSTSEFFVCRPDWHFLSRWWVNGKPYVPNQLKEFPADQDGMVSMGKVLDLHLTFDAKKIGAKRGDKIGLQLLYCRDEWSWVGDELMNNARLESEDISGLKLTNRVEFEAP